MSEQRTNFEKLEVYQLSEDLSDRIWSTVQEWNSFARDAVGQQLVEAADSIGANIAEGTGRGSIADHRRMIFIARGSLYETKHWLRRAYKRSLLTEHEISELKEIIEELPPRLNKYLYSLGKNVDSDQINEELGTYNTPSDAVSENLLASDFQLTIND